MLAAEAREQVLRDRPGLPGACLNSLIAVDASIPTIETATLTVEGRERRSR
jgi:hypothetical protein